MLNHYCAITRVDYKEFRQCLEKEQSALRSLGGSTGRGCGALVLWCCILSVLSCCYSQQPTLTGMVGLSFSMLSHLPQQARVAWAAFVALLVPTGIQIKSLIVAVLRELRSTVTLAATRRCQVDPSDYTYESMHTDIIASASKKRNDFMQQLPPSPPAAVLCKMAAHHTPCLGIALDVDQATFRKDLIGYAALEREQQEKLPRSGRACLHTVTSTTRPHLLLACT